jgi:hypothetical protein
MPAVIPFSCIAPVDPQGRKRREALRKRMRLASVCVSGAAALLVGMVVQAYAQGGLLPAAGLLLAGTLGLLEAFRQADRVFLAPLQAACQSDYSRQVDTLLRPLLQRTDDAA